MGPLMLRLSYPEDRYLKDLEANQERPGNAAAPSHPPASPAPVSHAPVNQAPASHALASPSAASPHAHAHVPPAPTPPAPVSPTSMSARLAAAKAAPAARGGGTTGGSSSLFGRAAAASPPESSAMLDELHPAISLRRSVLIQPNEVGRDPTLLQRARRTMLLAVAVLGAIAAVVAYLVLAE